MNTTKTAACSCGIISGHGHPQDFSDEFGGQAVVWDTGYDAAHGVAEYHREQGLEARVYTKAGFGWYVQVR